MFVSDSKSPCSENGLVLLDRFYMYRDRQIFTVNTVLIQQNSIVCMNALMTFQVRNTKLQMSFFVLAQCISTNPFYRYTLLSPLPQDKK